MHMLQGTDTLNAAGTQARTHAHMHKSRTSEARQHFLFRKQQANISAGTPAVAPKPHILHLSPRQTTPAALIPSCPAELGAPAFLALNLHAFHFLEA